jgi:uncharacterized protein with GYD domain
VHSFPTSFLRRPVPLGVSPLEILSLELHIVLLVIRAMLGFALEVRGRGLRRKKFSPEPENTEDITPHFMIRWQFTSASAKALVSKPNDRTGAAKALVEGFEGKLASYYLALGEYDGVAICEFPNNTAASPARCRLQPRPGSHGSKRRRAKLTAQEAEAARSKRTKPRPSISRQAHNPE